MIGGWTEDRVASLKKLWLEGLSASQIAKQLGGVTRNAVIGKVHRLGLSGRATPAAPARTVFKAPRAPRPAMASVHAPRRVEPVAASQPMPSLPAVREEPGSATVLTLGAHMCKWPIGDPAADGFTFCGRRTGQDGPYCNEHARVAYQPAIKKGKRSDAAELTRSLRRYI
ncbi:MAG TPA: GcrA family cell cycle regulator [Caulobacteraceae bacterium]|nr:GcrA family cell cycle regulator [Caulobacteraceae bacterium]